MQTSRNINSEKPKKKLTGKETTEAQGYNSDAEMEEEKPKSKSKSKPKAKLKKSSEKPKSAKASSKSKSSKSGSDEEKKEQKQEKRSKSKKSEKSDQQLRREGKKQANKTPMKLLEADMSYADSYPEPKKEAFLAAVNERKANPNQELEAKIVLLHIKRQARSRVTNSKQEIPLPESAAMFASVGATKQQYKEYVKEFKAALAKKKAKSKGANSQHAGKMRGRELAIRNKITGEPEYKIPAAEFKDDDDDYNTSLRKAFADAPYQEAKAIKKIKNLARDHVKFTRKRLTETELKAMDADVADTYRAQLKISEAKGVSEDKALYRDGRISGSRYAKLHRTLPPDAYFQGPKLGKFSFESGFKDAFIRFKEEHPGLNTELERGRNNGYLHVWRGGGEVEEKDARFKHQNKWYRIGYLQSIAEVNPSRLFSKTPDERRGWIKGTILGNGAETLPTEQDVRDEYPSEGDEFINGFIDGCKHRMAVRKRDPEALRAYKAGYQRRFHSCNKPTLEWLEANGFPGTRAVDYIDGWDKRETEDNRKGRNPILTRAKIIGMEVANHGKPRPVFDEARKARWAAKVGQQVVSRFIQTILKTYDTQKKLNEANGQTIKALHDKHLGGRQGYKDAIAEKPELTMEDYVYKSNKKLWRDEYTRRYKITAQALQAAKEHHAASSADDDSIALPELANSDPEFREGFLLVLSQLQKTASGSDESESRVEEQEADIDTDYLQGFEEAMAAWKDAQSKNSSSSAMSLEGDAEGAENNDFTQGLLEGLAALQKAQSEEEVKSSSESHSHSLSLAMSLDDDTESHSHSHAAKASSSKGSSAAKAKAPKEDQTQKKANEPEKVQSNGKDSMAGDSMVIAAKNTKPDESPKPAQSQTPRRRIPKKNANPTAAASGKSASKSMPSPVSIAKETEVPASANQEPAIGNASESAASVAQTQTAPASRPAKPTRWGPTFFNPAFSQQQPVPSVVNAAPIEMKMPESVASQVNAEDQPFLQAAPVTPAKKPTRWGPAKRPREEGVQVDLTAAGGSASFFQRPAVNTSSDEKENTEVLERSSKKSRTDSESAGVLEGEKTLHANIINIVKI